MGETKVFGTGRFLPTAGSVPHARIAVLLVLACCTLGAPAFAASSCDQNYRRAIEAADAAGQPDDADMLRSLKPLEVQVGADDDTVICTIWLPADAVSWGTAGYDDPLDLNVKIDGEVRGGIIPGSESADFLYRTELSPPYHQIGFGVGVDEDEYKLRHLWRTNKLDWLRFTIVARRFLLLPLALWAGFVLAWSGGRKSAEEVAADFEKARREGYEGIFWIGGMRWTLKDKAFSRVTHVFKRLSEHDVIEHFDRATRLEREATIGWPEVGAAIVYPPFADFVLFSSPSDGPTTNVIMRLIGALFLFSCLWGIVSTYLRRRGYQGVYGAMVLDPASEVGLRKAVEDQKVHGKSDWNDEAKTAAAARGTMKPTPIHDQEF